MVSFKEVLVLALVTVATAYADSANENLIKACTNEGDNTEDVKAFFDKHYVPNNGVIAIVGDVDHTQWRASIFRAWRVVAHQE